MPQLFKIGDLIVYFWSNESHPEEPVHVHVAKGKPAPNATKFWIMKNGKTLLANNNSRLNAKELRIIQRVIEANSGMIVKKWAEHFETLTYYC